MLTDKRATKSDLPYWLALVRAPQLGPVTFARLKQQALTVPAIFDLPEEALRQAACKPQLIDLLSLARLDRR